MKDPKAYLTAEQVAKVLEAETNLRDKLLIRMLWATGARVTEVTNIRVSMVSLDDRLVTIRSLKKAQTVRLCPKCEKRVSKDHAFCPKCSAKIDKPLIKQRGTPDDWVAIPIDAKTVEMVKQYLAARGSDSDWLFTADGKRPLTRVRAYQVVRQACERVGITKIGDPRITKRGLHPHPHSFRHSFAMDFVKGGGRPEVLQRILRHVSYDTTRSYERFTNKDLRDEYDRVRGGK